MDITDSSCLADETYVGFLQCLKNHMDWFGWIFPVDSCQPFIWGPWHNLRCSGFFIPPMPWNSRGERGWFISTTRLIELLCYLDTSVNPKSTSESHIRITNHKPSIFWVWRRLPCHGPLPGDGWELRWNFGVSSLKALDLTYIFAAAAFWLPNLVISWWFNDS